MLKSTLRTQTTIIDTEDCRHKSIELHENRPNSKAVGWVETLGFTISCWEILQLLFFFCQPKSV